MRKKIISIFILCCLSVALFSQQSAKPKVVIVPFDAKGVPQDEADVVTELFISEYAATGKATVPDRNSFDKLAKEQSFQASSWSDSEKIAKLGKAINANQAVVGQIMKFREEIIVTIKVIDINTTEILSSKTERLKDISQLFNKIPGICKELAEKSNYVPMQYKVGDEGEGGGIIFYVSQEGFVVYDGMGGESLPLS
ncbi:MAG: CsgG/HfaB family protein [Treponema succinifaciens]|nr:MAG: CsgG/HfaB family protein [Treponema succinifaciens]